MLLVDRKAQEEVVILLTDGTVITVKLVDVTNKQVRLGFEADKNIKIFRQEVYLEKLSEGSL